MSDDHELDELTDAIIEDTVHCDLCGCSWVLGGNEDGFVCTLPRRLDGIDRASFGGMSQLKLCYGCGAFVALTYEQFLQQRDACEHGIICGEWCEPCNDAYREARLENGDDD